MTDPLQSLLEASQGPFQTERPAGGVSLEEKVQADFEANPPKFLGKLPVWWEDEERRLNFAWRSASDSETKSKIGRELSWHLTQKEWEQEEYSVAKQEFEESGLKPDEFAKKKFFETNDHNGLSQNYFLSVIEAGLDSALLDRAGTLWKMLGQDEWSKQAYESVDHNAQVRAVANRYSDWGPWWEQTAGRLVGEDEFRRHSQAISGSLAKFATAAPLGTFGVIGDATATSAVRGLYDADQAGLKGTKRYIYAALQGGIEGGVTAAFQRFGVGGIESLPKWGLNKSLVRTVAEEVPEELVIGAAQMAASDLMKVEDISIDTFNQRMADILVQTIGTAGLAAGIGKHLRDIPWLVEDSEDPIFGDTTATPEPQPAQTETEQEGTLVPQTGPRSFLVPPPEAAPAPQQEMAFSSDSPSRKEFEQKTGLKGTNRQQRSEYVRQNQATQPDPAGAVQPEQEETRQPYRFEEGPQAARTPIDEPTDEDLESPSAAAVGIVPPWARPAKPDMADDSSGVFPDPVRDRLDEADNPKGPGPLAKSLSALHTGIKAFIPEAELGARSKWFAKIIGGGPKFEPYRRTFRLLRLVKEYAGHKVSRRLTPIVQHLGGDNDAKLFRNYLIVEDQYQGMKRGERLSYGFTPATVMKARADLHRQVNSSKGANARAALQERSAQLYDLQQKLVDAGLLGQEHLGDVSYFHREIRARVDQAAGRGRGSTTQVGKKGFQKKRATDGAEVDQELDPESNYLMAESAWMMDAEVSLRDIQLLNEFRQKSQVLSQEAQDHTDQNGVPLKEAYATLGLEDYRFGMTSHFYPKMSVTDKAFAKIAEAFENGEMQIDFEETGITEQDFKEVLLHFMRPEILTLPKEVVAEIRRRDTQGQRGFNAVLPAADRIASQWKRWILLNPRTVTMYNLRNLVGDLEVVVGATPLSRSPRQMKRDVKEALDYFFKPEAKLSKEMEAAIEEGVIYSGQIAELGGVADAATLRRFLPNKNAVTRYFESVGVLTSAREAATRYGVFRSYLEALDKGKLTDYGAVPKHAVKELQRDKGNTAAAALLTNELMIDYSNTSVGGQWLASSVMPFWRFMGGNMKRWPRMEYNALVEQYREVLGKNPGDPLSKHAHATIATTAVMIRRHMLLAGIMAWNMLEYPEEWDDLPEFDRSNTPLILGRTDDGKIRLFRNISTLGDMWELSGIPELLSQLPDYQAGQITTEDLAWGSFDAVKTKILRSIGGLGAVGTTKVIAEVAMKEDMATGRAQSRTEIIGNFLGIRDTAKWMEGFILKNGSRGRDTPWLSKEFYQRSFPGMVDPRKSALYETYDNIANFRKSIEKEVGGSQSVSKWKPVREALMAEDYGKFKEAMVYRMKHGGSQKGFKRFLDGMDPQRGLAKKDLSKFHQFLRADQKEKLMMARDYSSELNRRALVYFRKMVDEGFTYASSQGK